MRARASAPAGVFRLVALLLAWLALIGLPAEGPAFAQEAAEPAPPAAPETVTPEVRAFLNLLTDPSVRVWLEQQAPAAAADQPSAEAADVAAETPAAAPEADQGADFASRLAFLRAHLGRLAATLPMLPEEFRRAGSILMLELEERGPARVLLLVAAFVALGFGAEWLFWRATARIRRGHVEAHLDTVRERLLAMASRFAYGLGLVTVFAIGSVGAFLALDWPILLREIVVGYLMAFLALRIALVVGRFLLAPGYDRLRIVPMSEAAARFWHVRLAVLIGWFAFAWVTLQLITTLGVARPAVQLVAYLLGLGLLAVALEIAWRRPRRSTGAEPAGVRRRRWATAGPWLLSVYFIAVWLFWVVGTVGLFWLAAVALGLPLAIGVTQRSIGHVLRPPGAPVAGELPSPFAVGLERGARAALVIGAALLLARGFHVDLAALTAGDGMVTRLIRGAINAVIILLLADVAWHVSRAVIDRKLAEAHLPGHAEGEEARRRSRTRTLLPIMRNILFIVLMVMAILMALSAMGIEIGPLIAGAGVVGVAIGFGAQTIVKDIISGMFFLLDDAFRVGEYVQSGEYKGTVESFSLRSVKLRHHRGSLYTVPFGELGAIQNMSRDWVIDKLSVGVTYDTDLDQVKKLIKDIGKQLTQDPDLGPHIIETLKMQGVEQFGDFAIQIRMKLMAKPGEQFVIRRRALALIKKVFDANGIKFAFPTVQVAGGDTQNAAVAHHGLGLVQTPPAA